MRTSRRAELKIELNNSNSNASIENLINKMNVFLENKKPGILKHSVFLTDFTKSSTTITIEYFTEPFSMHEFLELKQECNVYIKQLLEQHDIKMANAGNDINIFNTDGGTNTVKNNSII
jgi:small-conductance mechanosensitive channel